MKRLRETAQGHDRLASRRVPTVPECPGRYTAGDTDPENQIVLSRVDYRPRKRQQSLRVFEE